MAETRKLAAILAADVVGYSRLAGADEDRTLARLRALRSDLIDPTVAVHNGRVVKRTGDGLIAEFRSVVDAVRCAIEIQSGLIERNAGLPPDKRIEFRVGIHLGDVIEEYDGDLMSDGVNIAARLEAIAKPGTIFLSEDAYRQVRDKVTESFTDLSEKELKNIARPVHVYAVRIEADGSQSAPHPASSDVEPPRLSIVVLPFANIGGDSEQDYFVDGATETLTTDLSRIRDSFVIGCNTAFTYKGKPVDLKSIRRELTFATFWKEAYSAVASACASTCNCSTPRPAGICGPSGSTSPSPVSSTCKTRSSRALPERSTRSSSMRRRAAPKGHRNPIR